MSDIVNVDTLVERLRTHITTDGLVVPSDEALATLDDLAARARDGQWCREVFEGDPRSFLEGYKDMEAEADRLARRVTELDTALRVVSSRISGNGGIAAAEAIYDEAIHTARAALAGDGGGA